MLRMKVRTAHAGRFDADIFCAAALRALNSTPATRRGYIIEQLDVTGAVQSEEHLIKGHDMNKSENLSHCLPRGYHSLHDLGDQGVARLETMKFFVCLCKQQVIRIRNVITMAKLPECLCSFNKEIDSNPDS